MLAALAVGLVIASSVTILSLVIEEAPNHQHDVYAQMQNLTHAPTNFTKLFSTDQEFQLCIEDISIPGLPCVPVIEVLYEDPTLLVLQSNYIDTIWKGVALAKKEGYQIDSMTSYAASSSYLSDSPQRINLLVAMSK
ncbi:MAG: hypothetical protein ACRD8Z_18425 [Nitrososphaeraceae archaeon]